MYKNSFIYSLKKPHVTLCSSLGLGQGQETLKTTTPSYIYTHTHGHGKTWNTQTVTVLTILLLWKQRVIDSLTLFFTNPRLHKPLAQWSCVLNQNQAQLSVPLTEVGMQRFSFFFSSRFGVMVTKKQRTTNLAMSMQQSWQITCNPQHAKANQLQCSTNLCFQSKTMQYELVFSIKDYVNKTWAEVLHSAVFTADKGKLRQPSSQRVFNASQPSPSSLAQR